MTASVIWLIFVLVWFWPGSVGRWLAEVRKAYEKAMQLKEVTND